MIKNAREPPFPLTGIAKVLSQDYDKLFEANIQKPKGMIISVARMIKYHPTGEVNVFDNNDYEKKRTNLYLKVKFAQL